MSCRFSFLSNLAILLYLERVSIVLARCLWTCLDVWSGKKVDISFIRLSRADRVDEIINSTPDVSEFFSHHEQPEGIADWKSMKLYLQPVLVLIQHFHCVPFVTFNLFLDICFSFFFFWQFSLRCCFFFLSVHCLFSVELMQRMQLLCSLLFQHSLSAFLHFVSYLALMNNHAEILSPVTWIFFISF